jgi:phenylalanine-4-hydroxylase
MSHLLQNLNSTLPKNTSNEVNYTYEENEKWKFLYHKQRSNLESLMHPSLLQALDNLHLPKSYIPTLDEVSRRLSSVTGWQVAKVDGLIKATEFFTLLSEKKFPSTTYIRSEEELSLSRDPDIFHEIFGHCPMLMIEEYADFVHKVGRLGLVLNKTQRCFLLRLFWFTFEVGLVQYNGQIKIFGGSLASSYLEADLAINSSTALRKPFSMLDILRTPYRADIPQSIYYILPDISQVTTLLDDVEAFKLVAAEAYELGEFAPLFTVDPNFSKYMSLNICRDKVSI